MGTAHPTTPDGATPPPQKNARLLRLQGFLALDPDNLSLLRECVHEALRCGDADAALGAMDALAGKGEEGTPAEIAALAALLRHAGRNAEAMERLRREVERRPGDALPAVELARCLFSHHEFEQALACMPAMVEEPELAADAAALRLRLLHHLGRLDEADALLSALPQDIAASPRVKSAQLALLIDLSRLDAAVRVARELLPQDETKAAPYEVAEPLALAALDQGQAGEALHWTEFALSLRRDDGRIWLTKGLGHLQEGDTASGREALQEAVRLMPGHAGSHLALGWQAMVAGDLPAARQAFDDAVSVNPSFSEGHGSLAVVDATQGRTEEARTNIRKAQRLDPHCASALFAATLLSDPSAGNVRRLADKVLARARRASRSSAAE